MPDFQPSVDGRNYLVGRFYLAHYQLRILLTDALFFQKIEEGFVEFRLDRAEAEPAPQGVIYDGQRAVGRVHAAYQINVLGYKETFVILVAVGQLDGVLLLAFVGLYQHHHQLTQNLADIPSVYLVDDEDKLL